MGLDGVELVMAFEEEFGISIPDSAAEKMVTPRHVIDFVYEARLAAERLDAQAHVLGVLEQIPEEAHTPKKLVDRLRRSISREEVAMKVKQIVLEQLGLNESAYGEDKRFIEDFGID